MWKLRSPCSHCCLLRFDESKDMAVDSAADSSDFMFAFWERLCYNLINGDIAQLGEHLLDV